MKELKNEIYDKNNGFWYKREGDYYFPEYYLGKGLTIKQATKFKEEKSKDDNTEITTNAILGKYGRARLNYIKEYKKGLYTELLMNGTLNKHLVETDRTANERIDNIIKSMAKQDNTNEELKRTDQFKWVGLMNNYKHCAEEIVYSALINC